MFNSTIIDVAIGVVFVYLLLALAASTINELILSHLNQRGKYLLQGLKELLNDDDLLSKVYNHGMIYGLFKGPYDPKNPGNLPAYIPARNFALALMDVVAAPDKAQGAAPVPGAPGGATTPPASSGMAPVSGAAGATAPTAPAPASDPAVGVQSDALSSARDLANKLPDTEVKSQLTAALEAAASQPLLAAGANQILNQATTDLRKAVAKIANEKVRASLIAMIDAANGNPAILRQNIEEWFNSGMDRVSGFYKHRTQQFLLLIAMLLVVFANADTFVIARQLANDPTLRQTVVASAQQYDASHKEDASKASGEQLKQKQRELEGLGLPIGWLDYTQTEQDGRVLPWRIPLRPVPEASEQKQQTEDSKQQSEKNPAGVPLAVWAPKAWWLLEFHFLGWLITALAVSIGAPFWFDVLNKFIVIRSTVKPKEKSPEEKSKS